MSPLSGTPARERKQSTHRSPAAGSSSASPSSHSTASPALAVDTLLATHSSASNPTLAALETAIQERNTLSAQNAQLWKLIEKQRSGYNQILKELERVRAERDTYRTKLGINPSERRHRTQSADDDAVPSRTLVSPDDQVMTTPRASSATPSRSHEQQRTFRSPPPASAPIRLDSLPQASSSQQPFPSSDTTLTSSTGLTNGSRKSSFAESVESSSSSLPYTSAPHPTLALPTNGLNPSTSSLATSVSSLSNLAAASIDTHDMPTMGTNPSLLSADSRILSRDSRVSLPDEAKRYIANMGESPIPSPRIGNSFSSQTAAPSQASRLEQVREQAVADSDSEDDDSLDDEQLNNDFEVLPSPDQTMVATTNERASSGTTQLPPGHPNTNPSDANPNAQAPSSQPQTAMSISTDPATLNNGRQQDTSPHKHRSDHDQDTHTATSPVKGGLEKTKPITFHALPLLFSDLPRTTISVVSSFVRPNDRGKDVLTFTIVVSAGPTKQPWKVEKLYSDVIALDQRVRSSADKRLVKKVPTLPDGRLWRDHAPAKADQRKVMLEGYLQALINLPVKNNDEVIAFFTKDIVREAKQPVMQSGHKEGYLTKRGKNFGGWKTRYFVLSGPVLEYYDCRGGAHLGSIVVTGAQIGRQTSQAASNAEDGDKEFRHAFLIVEQKKGPGGNHPRHVLCAESDEQRDAWVDMLVRYFTGKYSEEGVTTVASSSESIHSREPRRTPSRALSRDDIAVTKGSAVPISQLTPDNSNAKLFSSSVDLPRSPSPSGPSPVERPSLSALNDSQMARKLLNRDPGQPSSLPDAVSPLSNVGTLAAGPRSNSELGHYPDLQEHSSGRRFVSPERHRTASDNPRKTLHPSHGFPPPPVTPDRAPSPEKSMDPKIKISGPLNGAPIPAGYKFGGKDAAPEASPSNDRREKAKSRSFWGFGKQPQPPAMVPRAVFGVSLDESLEIASIASLPAIVFRAIQYLETKKADQEEGIYRLSGSSAVIKTLKDRFNMEGDVDLLGSDDYWDPHAISGLLKSFLRELPASILTRELHLKFLAVIDFVDPQERIRELSQLIAALPIANYSLLRALTAHLILIVQNSSVNKMTMRNVGIVFSPTLGIPAGVLSLMLGEFNRVFNVDNAAAEEEDQVAENASLEMARRNSQRYSDTAADKLLGLAGRSLTAPEVEENSDEGGDAYESSSETQTLETRDSATVEDSHEQQTEAPRSTSKAAQAAAGKNLNVSVTESSRGNRYSRMIGLPSSPRPPASPASPAI